MMAAVPEGQVSHRNALRFDAVIVGRTVLEVIDAPRTAAQRIPERLVGDTVRAAEAVGKHHLLRFESGRTLHTHLMMRGVWHLFPAADPVPRSGLWLALVTDEWTAAQYNGSVVRLYEPGRRIPALDTVGQDLIDATDPGMSMRNALAMCDPAREIGDALMDQRLTSGIGNVYKSETCFLASIDPWRAVGTLSADEATSLGTIAAELLRQGVADGGPITTFTPPRGSRSRERTWVYRRRERPCRRCGTVIQSRGQGDGNRTTYWCPTCQH